MSTQIDDALLKRIDHLVEATDDVQPITDTPEFQGAIHHGRQRCLEARDGLAAAARARAIDMVENATTAADFTDKAATAVDEYGYLRESIRTSLLNVPPSVRVQLGPAEMTRRARFIEEFLPLSVSEVARMGRQAIVTHLTDILSSLVGEWAIQAETLQGFETAVEELQKSWGLVLHELVDDAELENKLLEARALASTRTIAMRGLLEAILRFENKALDVDTLLLKTPPKKTSGSAADFATTQNPPQTPANPSE